MGDYGEVWYELKEASVGGHYYYLMWSNQPRRTNLKKIGVNLAFEFVVVANWPRKNRKNSTLSFHEFFPLNKKKEKFNLLCVARRSSEVAIENERDYSQQLLDWMAMRLAYHESFSLKNLPMSTTKTMTTRSSMSTKSMMMMVVWKLC